MQAKVQCVFLEVQNIPQWLLDRAASEDTGSICRQRTMSARTNMKKPQETLKKL